MTGDVSSSETPKPGKTEKPGWRILRNGGWLLGGKTLGAILSFVYLAMITRSLGPADFGKFAIIFSLAQVIAGLISFQTWQIIIRYGTKYILEKASDEFAKLVWLCLALDALGILLGTLLTLGGVWGVASYFGWGGEESIKIIVFTIIILLATRGTAIGILRVHDRFRDAALADSLVPIIRFVGVGIVVFLGPTVERVLIVWALSEIATTIIMWGVILCTVPVPLRRQKLTAIPSYYRKYPDIMRFAAFTNLGSSLRLMSQQVVVLAVGFFTGTAAAGFFRLGHQLGQVLARIADGLSFAIFTEYSRMTHRDGGDAARSMIGRTIRVTAISALILLALLALAGKSLIIAIFGLEFAPAYPLILLLGGAAAVQVGAMALEPVLMTHGRAGWVLLGNFAGVLLMAVLFFVLMPAYDVVGAAWAVLGGALMTALALGFAYRRLNDEAAQ